MCLVRILLPLLIALAPASAPGADPPLGPGCVGSCESDYPASNTILDFDVEVSTLSDVCPGIPCAGGSDNWPVTWSDDGHQYTSWGDGCGFGGDTTQGCKSSLGFGRVEGPPGAYAGVNVWGGRLPTNPEQFGGKVYGLLSIGGILYAFRCGNGSSESCYRFQEIHRSADKGATWTELGNPLWCNDDSHAECAAGEFADTRGFFAPSFVNAGKDYANAFDSNVYAYACNVKDPLDWDVQQPGEIVLLRAPANDAAIMSKASWEYYSGPSGGETTVEGATPFAASADARTPVWQDDDGCHRVSAFYNWRLGRFFLTVQMGDRHRDDGARMGIFESERPWGPWRTVHFEDPFVWPEQNGTGDGPIQAGSKTVFWNFSAKWLAAAGRDFVLVGTIEGSDEWGSMSGSFSAPSIAPVPGVALTAGGLVLIGALISIGARKLN